MAVKDTLQDGAPKHIVSCIQQRAYAGTHMVADFWGAKEIMTEKELSELLLGAAKEAGAYPLQTAIHRFEPRGITGAVILSESHIALHTWPERDYTAIDVFTCGKADPRRAIAYFERILKPVRTEIRTMRRGSFDKT